MDVKYSTDTKIGDCHRLYLLQQATFDKEVQTAKAEAGMKVIDFVLKTNITD